MHSISPDKWPGFRGLSRLLVRPASLAFILGWSLPAMPATAAPAPTAAPATSTPATASPRVWPMYQNAPDHNAVFGGTLNVSWTYDTGSKINGGLAIVGDTLYASNFKQQTFALDLLSGKPRWTGLANNVVMTTPVVTGGLVIVGSGKNWVTTDTVDRYIWSVPSGDDIIAYHTRDGSVAWHVHTFGEDMPSGGLSGSRLVLANGDMHAYGIDANTGQVAWTTSIPGVDTMGSTAVDGSIAYTIASMGVPYLYGVSTHVLALSVDTGKTLWSAPYGNADCSPTLGGGLVFVEGNSNVRHDPYPIDGYDEVYGLEQTTGKLVWKYVSETKGYYTHVGSSERAVAGTYADGVLYQSLPVSDEFVALRARDGKMLWKIRTKAPVKMSAVISNGIVYFGDTAGLLYAVASENGNIKNVTSFNAPFTTSPAVVYGKTLFIANSNVIYAIPLSQL